MGSIPQVIAHVKDKQEHVPYENGRPRYCGRHALHYKPTGDMYPAMCKTWGCPVCGPVRGRWLQGRLAAAIEQFTDPWFVTLTIDPKVPLSSGWDLAPDQYTKMVRDRARRSWMRKRKHSYVWVIEFHKARNEQGLLNNPFPHNHELWDGQPDEALLHDSWVRSGGGVQIDVRPVDNVETATAYMCKYAKKDAIMTSAAMNKGSRVWGRSRDLSAADALKSPIVGTSDWEYIPDYVFETEQSREMALQSEHEYDILVARMNASYV